MPRSLKRKILSLVFLCAAAALTARIIAVNLQWPAAPITKIAPQESVSVSGLSLRVDAASIAAPAEIYAEYQIGADEQEQLFVEQMLAQGWEAKILSVTLSAANETDGSITFRAGSLMAECGPWSNGIDNDLFRKANQLAGTVELAPHETKTLHLFYDLYDQHFTADAWQNIESQPFALTISLYPEKILLCV